MKRLTRRQACQWLKPVRSCFAEMKTGECDSIQGYIVTRLHAFDSYERTDQCIEGFVGLLNRLALAIDLMPLERLRKRLASGVMLNQKEIDDALHTLNHCEDALVKVTIPRMKDAVATELVAIELDQLGLRKAA